MPTPGRYHNKVADLMNIERDLLLGLVQESDLLAPHKEALLRWAITVGRMCLMRCPDGHDVEVEPVLAPFRTWLIERLRTAIGFDGKIDGRELRSLCPAVDHRLDAARSGLLERFVNDFGADDLAREVMNKKLVLVLGGGGGSGFVHLSTFHMIEELGLKPAMMTGASMGALLGLFRSMDLDYDAEMLAAALPETFDLTSVFTPFTGTTRFGFPGAFHMQLLRVASEAIYRLQGTRRLPTFGELPVRLEVVATGVRTGFVASSALERDILAAAKGGAAFSPFAVRRKMRAFFNAAKELSANPKFLKQLVFGQEKETKDFNVIEAVGFSCSVPGLFSYDVFHDDPFTINTLHALFRRHRLWRLTDGGVVNNVASRTAWESVMKGNLGSRNAFIFAGDAFAPSASASNLPFVAIQQIARPPVLSNRPFSDFHKTFKSPPSPLNLSPSYPKLKRIVKKGLRELSGDKAYIARAMAPLPPYRSWSS